MDTDTLTPSLIAVCQMTHTHSLIGVCQIMCTDTLMHSLLHSLLSVKSHIQIHSHIHFTHCYVSNHGYKYTHTLTSLIAVKSHIQINSHTHFTHCCVSDCTNRYTHSLTSLIAVCQVMHTYIHSLKHIFRTVQPFGTKCLCVSASPRSRVLWRDGFALFTLRSPWGLS